MFKKTQDYLLLHRPLLWNTKVVPMIAVTLAIHILFFIVGFASGAIDFSEANEDFSYDATEGYGVFSGILLGMLVSVVWLVFYFRNNAFKSYYPKKRASLYHEWLLVLLICVLNWSYPLSLMYGRDVRAQSYYNEAEAARRTDIISLVSLFADGAFQKSGDSIIEREDRENVQVFVDTFKYGKRYYPIKSLLNKSITDFGNQDPRKDSLNERRVKSWLVNNQKDSVLWVMREFDKIAKEHNGPTNLTPAKWLDIVYQYPDFATYITVGRMYFYESNDSVTPYRPQEEYTVTAVGPDTNNSHRLTDTISNVIKVKNGYTYIYPKYYVPLRQVENAYQEVANAWANPDANGELALIYFFVGLMLSLFIFSFRVTSGRSWLVAIVGFGVTALGVGAINLLLFEVLLRRIFMRSFDEYAYFGFWLIIVAILFGYIFNIKKQKRHSDIAINVLMWLTPWVIPVICMIVDKILNELAVYEQGRRITPRTGFEIFFDDYTEWFWTLNAMLFVLFMYVFTAYIKKWKGIPEA